MEKRIRSIMEHPEYVKKKNPAVVKHVQDEFERAYPGEVQYDETGRMVQPKPVIKPDEVRAYDPNGELHPNDDTGFIIDEGSLFDEQPDETQTAFGANDIASNEPIEQPDNGTVTQNPDSTFTFKPDNDWDAETNATYTTSDGIEKTPQSSPYEEQVADPDWENERFEVRDPQTGKLYQMDFNGDYFNKQGNPVSLSNEAKNRLNEQFNKDEGFIETENRKKQSNASKAEQAETIEFNADAFADTLEKRLKPKGKKLGDCAAYVRVALEKAGMDTSGHPVDAKDWGPTLEKNGFTPVDKNNYVPKKGDVVVFQTYPGGHPSGHMAGFNGKNWMSDYEQWDLWGGKGRRKYKPPHVIYRKTR